MPATLDMVMLSLTGVFTCRVSPVIIPGRNGGSPGGQWSWPCLRNILVVRKGDRAPGGLGCIALGLLWAMGHSFVNVAKGPAPPSPLEPGLPALGKPKAEADEPQLAGCRGGGRPTGAPLSCCLGHLAGRLVLAPCIGCSLPPMCTLRGSRGQLEGIGL